MTFKQDILQLAQEVATEISGWALSKEGNFIYQYTKDTQIMISTGFCFTSDSTTVDPRVEIKNKKFSKLTKNIYGADFRCLGFSFVQVSEKYRTKERPAYLRKHWHGYYEKGVLVEKPAGFYLLSEAKSVLRQVLHDGIAIIDEYLDLSCEVNLINHLPLGRKPQSTNGEPPKVDQYPIFADGEAGLKHCLMRLVVGNFEFMDYYISDAFVTGYPKPIDRLNKIIAILPELKQRYAETGSVI